MLCSNKDLKNYNIVRTIGKGAYGEVELIELKSTNELLARKFNLLGPDYLFTSGTLNEINNFQIFNNCEGIINFKGICVEPSTISDDGYASLFFEYMDMDLKDWLRTKSTSFRLEKFLLFFKQISIGIINLHNGTISHNDLKTENILVKNDNIFKLADLGISGNKFWVKNFNFIGGTVTSRPPESLAERDPNSYYFTSSDLWSFGLCCIYFLTNYRLFTNDSIDDILESIHKHSTARNLTFEEFKERCKNGTIKGNLDINYIFDLAKLPNLKNEIYAKYIFDLCCLDPFQRKLPTEKVDNQLMINIANYYYDSYLLVRHVNLFNITIPEKVICIELFFRYLKLNNLPLDKYYNEEIFVIVGLVRKYFGTIYDIDEDFKILSGNLNGFDDLCIKLLESINYRIYNPRINISLMTMSEISKSLLCANMYTFTKPNINDWFKESYEEYDLYIKDSLKIEKSIKFTLIQEKVIDAINKLYNIYYDYVYSSYFYTKCKIGNNRTIPYTLSIYTYCMSFPNIFQYESDVVLICCLIISTIINERVYIPFSSFESIIIKYELKFDEGYDDDEIYKDVCSVLINNKMLYNVLPFDYSRIGNDLYIDINRYILLLSLTNNELVNNVKPSFLESKTKKLAEDIYNNNYNITDNYTIKIIRNIRNLNTRKLIDKELLKEQYVKVINYVNNFMNNKYFN